MVDRALATEIKTLEQEIAESEKQLGLDHPDLVEKLSKYAALLKKTEVRVLEAANTEARVKTIRAKMYAAEAETHKTTIDVPKPKKAMKKASAATYLGVAGIFIALACLFLDQSFFAFLAPLCILLCVIDVILTRGEWWRAVACLLLVVWGWWGINSLPQDMLLAASPLDRLNYEVNNPALVAHVRALGNPVQVISYSIRLPKSYGERIDDRKEWGRLFTWKSAEGFSNGSISLASMMVPDHIRKSLATAPLMKITEEIVLPKISEPLQLKDLKTDTGEIQELNGYEFAVVNFSAVSQSDEPVRGVVYVTKDRRTLVVIYAWDKAVSADQTLARFEASINTFKKMSREVNLEEPSKSEN